MNPIAEQLSNLPGLNSVALPDLWQQEAVAALRAGRDVVVHAPTGAGKTLIFELWSNQGRCRGQAIYTVPTRALANDKLAEWRSRGWNAGIATGDLAENLDAPVVVATLETQKNRLIAGEGPDLLVVDEYQLIRDPDRGLNYELALALARPQTQLLLLSGSVGNPQDVVAWLRRIGREAVLVRHDERPVPLEEVQPDQLSYHLPSSVKGYWPRFVAKALADDLGPILIFAPRRQAAEALAGELARILPCPDPLTLTPEQKQLIGENLSRMVKARVAFHHSGLSYGARAGVIEPLAKAGQLRVVVATMGLAAGINFSLRSVALAGDSYRRDYVEQPLKPDEILQMFGRAGRRGLDETGYVLISANKLRLLDAWPCQLSRGGTVDWSALLGLMNLAAAAGRDPFAEAVRVQERLFTTRPIALGIEECLRHPQTPCGLKTDSERARHVRRRVRQFLNSQNEWEDFPPLVARPLREVFLGPTPSVNSEGKPPTDPQADLRSALSEPEALSGVGIGELCVISEGEFGPLYGRRLTVADGLSDGRIHLTKWIRRLINWRGRQVKEDVWEQEVVPCIEKRMEQRKLPVLHFQSSAQRIVAQLSLAEQLIRVPVDRHGVALWKPAEREVLPPDCAVCTLVPVCCKLPTSTGVALLWRRMGLIAPDGRPTPRGRIVSFFSQGYGLAIAAALENPAYPIEELVYDLANLDAGFRFCGDDNRWAGRLAMACQRIFRLQSIPGYLENGLPPKYGAGAEQIVAAVHRNPAAKHAWISGLVGPGDIDRVIIEWRSLLRQISHAPSIGPRRWAELQEKARAILHETESPTLTDLPPLEYHQTKRVDHRLILRRH